MMRLLGLDIPKADLSDWNIREVSDFDIEAKARQRGGIGWMERVGIISTEAAKELEKRFPESLLPR